MKPKHIVFCKAKILIKKSESPTSNMIKTFAAFMNILLKIDKSMVIFKYKDKSNTTYITRPNQIPDTPSKVKHFFHESHRPRSEAHQVWPELKIGLSVDIESFTGYAKCLLEDKRLGFLFKKDLQAEETEDIGFFLFSNRFQDTKRVTSSIQREIMKTYTFKPDLNLRWRKIFDPTKKNKEKNENKEEIKAIFIEVIKGQDEKIAKAISKIYSSTKGTYLDGKKMRFIPRPWYTQNTGLYQRYSELINRQNWYLQGIDRATTFEKSTLDKQVTGLSMSARMMIMTMTKNDVNQMFTSVDESCDSGVVFTFPKMYEEEARNRITDMSSYLHYHHGDTVLFKYLNPDAHCSK